SHLDVLHSRGVSKPYKLSISPTATLSIPMTMYFAKRGPCLRDVLKGRCRYARHSHHFIRAKRSRDRWLSNGDGWRGWQSRICTRTSSVRSYVRNTRTLHDEALQKNLSVGEHQRNSN